jgi:hypothetical protein
LDSSPLISGGWPVPFGGSNIRSWDFKHCPAMSLGLWLVYFPGLAVLRARPSFDESQREKSIADLWFLNFSLNLRGLFCWEKLEPFSSTASSDSAWRRVDHNPYKNCQI